MNATDNKTRIYGILMNGHTSTKKKMYMIDGIVHEVDEEYRPYSNELCQTRCWYTLVIGYLLMMSTLIPAGIAYLLYNGAKHKDNLTFISVCVAISFILLCIFFCVVQLLVSNIYYCCKKNEI